MAVSAAELAIITGVSTGVFTLCGVWLTNWLNGRAEQRREDRAARQATDRTVTELQTATVDLMSGIDVVRNTQTRMPGAHYARVAAVVLSALGSALAAASPTTTTDPPLLNHLKNWRHTPPFIDRVLAGDQQITDAQRAIALDLSTMLLPRTTRFFAAAITLMSGPEEWLAEATGDLMNAVGDVLGAIDPRRDRPYQQARKQAERALATFQRTIREHAATKRS